MAKRKGDIGIGYRAASECRRLFKGTKEACDSIGCSHNLVNEWGRGLTPSALYLARLHELGADVIWILTGKKNTSPMGNAHKN